MKIEKIKPIPKYIQKKIKLYDDKLKTAPLGRTRFYAYFTKNDGELVKVTVAVREYKKLWYCKPVVVHGVHSDKCFGKDIKFTCIAGYSVGWHEQGISKYPDWYESKEWGWAINNSFDPYAPIVNREYIHRSVVSAEHERKEHAQRDGRYDRRKIEHHFEDFLAPHFFIKIVSAKKGYRQNDEGIPHKYEQGVPYSVSVLRMRVRRKKGF